MKLAKSAARVEVLVDGRVGHVHAARAPGAVEDAARVAYGGRTRDPLEQGVSDQNRVATTCRVPRA